MADHKDSYMCPPNLPPRTGPQDNHCDFCKKEFGSGNYTSHQTNGERVNACSRCSSLVQNISERTLQYHGIVTNKKVYLKEDENLEGLVENLADCLKTAKISKTVAKIKSILDFDDEGFGGEITIHFVKP